MQVSTAHAQMKVASGEKTAGFSFTREAAATEPVINYQQNIHMLVNIDDRPSLTVYGDGRVLVHYPVYMKRAGDYDEINVYGTLSCPNFADGDLYPAGSLMVSSIPRT